MVRNSYIEGSLLNSGESISYTQSSSSHSHNNNTHVGFSVCLSSLQSAADIFPKLRFKVLGKGVLKCQRRIEATELGLQLQISL